MILVRSPLRITLGGGGTDLPSYSDKHGGFCVAAAINQYVYITIHRNFGDGLVVRYSEMERVTGASEVKNNLIRECFGLLKMDGRGLEVTCMADIPAGTGLGSSSAFCCALLRALHAVRRELVSPRKIAEEAVEVELGRLKEPIGKQDQFASALGGVVAMRFSHTGNIEAWNIPVTEHALTELEENLLLFFTGFARSASEILRKQNESMEENLGRVKRLGLGANELLVAGDIFAMSDLINQQWEAKEARGISDPKITAWREAGLAAGATGCKLIGAGGGGFLMFYCDTRRSELRREMAGLGLKEVRFSFDHAGTTLL